MSFIGGFLLNCILLPILVSSKQIRYPEHIEAIHEFPGQPIPPSEYPIFRASPDQDLSSESVGIEFEDGIIRSMLQIVDGKFNTLSTRMTSLERGINSLQVYLSRQFRHVTKNLQAVNIVMNSLHAEVSHVDMETRSVRNSILALNKEFLDYRNKNLGVFRELPRVGHRTVPVDTVVDSKVKLNHSRRTDWKKIDVKYNISEKPVFLPSPEEMNDGVGNFSIDLEDMQTYTEKGFAKLNQTVGQRFDELHNVTENIQENLVTVRDGMAEINDTLRNSIIDQYEMQDGVKYLKSMMDYLLERQDQVMMDITFLRGHAVNNKVLPGPEADQIRTTTADTKCPTTTSGNIGSIDIKSEFEKISEKLDIIDSRAEEVNDNLVYTSDVLEASRNNTQHVVKLVEALSGSTIWIPHILREVKLSARALNESINATYLVYKQILGRRSDTLPGDQLPGKADGKMKESGHHQNSAPNLNCKINDEDTKLLRHQISKVEEILKKLDNTTVKKESHQEKSQPTPILLRKKEVRGNSTSGILSIQSSHGWLHVCYDEAQSNLVSKIACTQLGFSLGTPLIVPNLLDSIEKAFTINCQRKEPNLDYCGYEIVSSEYCRENGLLGVFCIE